jgi:hypothetical protein
LPTATAPRARLAAPFSSSDLEAREDVRVFCRLEKDDRSVVRPISPTLKRARCLAEACPLRAYECKALFISSSVDSTTLPPAFSLELLVRFPCFFLRGGDEGYRGGQYKVISFGGFRGGKGECNNFVCV